jgi:hypothetical protein
MGSSTSTSSGGGGSKSRKTPVQTYEQFKTPEGRTAAVQRQQKILDSTRTSTGAFANQEAELVKAGYKLNEKKNAVLTQDGKTVAGVTSTGSLFSGSKKVTDIIKSSQPKTVDQFKAMSKADRQTNRIATSLETMSALEQLDEPSKAREARIQKSLNYGRGVQFAPTVLDPTRIVASTPTLSEVGGDIMRGLGGGTAPSVPYLKKGYQPEPVKGLIPTVVNAAISGSLSPITAIMKGVSSSGFFSYGDSKDSGSNQNNTTPPSKEFGDIKEADRIARKNKLAGGGASDAIKGRSLFQIGSNLTFGGK